MNMVWVVLVFYKRWENSLNDPYKPSNAFGRSRRRVPGSPGFVSNHWAVESPTPCRGMLVVSTHGQHPTLPEYTIRSLSSWPSGICDQNNATVSESDCRCLQSAVPENFDSICGIVYASTNFKEDDCITCITAKHMLLKEQQLVLTLEETKYAMIRCYGCKLEHHDNNGRHLNQRAWVEPPACCTNLFFFFPTTIQWLFSYTYSDNVVACAMYRTAVRNVVHPMSAQNINIHHPVKQAWNFSGATWGHTCTWPQPCSSSSWSLGTSRNLVVWWPLNWWPGFQDSIASQRRQTIGVQEIPWAPSSIRSQALLRIFGILAVTKFVELVPPRSLKGYSSWRPGLYLPYVFLRWVALTKKRQRLKHRHIHWLPPPRSFMTLANSWT